jgi:hypothetical protein
VGVGKNGKGHRTPVTMSWGKGSQQLLVKECFGSVGIIVSEEDYETVKNREGVSPQHTY